MILLPKNLKPKTKIAYFYLKNLVLAIAFLIITINIINFLNFNSTISMTIKILFLIVSLIILFYSEDGQDFLGMLQLKFNYILDNKYIIYKKRRVKKSERVDNEIHVKKTDEELIDEIKKYFKVKHIDNDERILSTTDGFVTFLEIKISKHPDFETQSQSNNSLQQFHKLIMELLESGNGKIFTINSIIYDSEYEKNINNLNKNNFYYNLKKFQINKSKNHFNLQYFVEIKSKSKEELLLEKDKLLTNFSSKFSLNNVQVKDFNRILEKKWNNRDIVINQDYIFNNITDKYETYISLEKFEVEQNFYYLRNIFKSNFDIVMLFRNPGDFTDDKTINSAYAELKTNSKYDKTFTNVINHSVHMGQLKQITSELKSGTSKLIAIDIIIKIEARNLTKLIKQKNTIMSRYKDKIKFYNNIFNQKGIINQYYKTGIDIKDKYIMSSEYLSYSYPFSFVSFIQKKGLIKNVDSDNLLILNSHTKSKEQRSFGVIAFGDKGSGKSTLIKETAIDDVLFYNGNVIMMDFDGETETLINNLDGKFINISVTKVNLLRIKLDPTKKDNISEHLVFVSKFLKILYPNIDEIYLRKQIKELYLKYDIIEENLLNVKEYPTITQLIDFLEKQNQSDSQNILLEKLKDMKMIYPHLTNEDIEFNFDNRIISISFSSIKDNDELTSSLMYYFIYLINRRIRLNHFQKKIFKDDEEKFKKYLKYYLEQINSAEKYNELSELSNEEIEKYFINNKKMFSIIIDEFHRTLKFPELVMSLVQVAREDRKYFVKLFLADQTTHGLETNEEFLKIYSLMQYKIFFSLEETNKNFLNQLSFLPREIREITEQKFLPGEGILKLGSSTFRFFSPINSETDAIFEGRN